MKTLVSAHNCVFGPRFLGIYGSTIREWRTYQQDLRCFFVVDDVVGSITQPVDAKTYSDKAQVVAADFLLGGVDPKKASIVLISEVPEIYELAVLLSCAVGLDDMRARYDRSVFSVMSVAQRKQLGLNAQPSIGEVFYAHYVISAYALGLGADIWQGGAEVEANHRVMTSIASSFNKKYKKKVLRVPRFVPGREPKLPAADGDSMTFANQLPLNASPRQITEQVHSIEDWKIAASWLNTIGADREAERISAVRVLDDASRTTLVNLLVAELAPFRTRNISNAEVLRALSFGTKVARKKISETLSVVRATMRIGSYLAQAKSARQIR